MAMLCIRPNPCDHQHTLYDRMSKLLESFEWSDVTFILGNSRLKAHKLILAISSPVFKVMLYGPMAEESEIDISDIEPEVFQLLLDFIYKDKVVIDTLENACGLLYASKKYMLPYLSDMCIKYIKNSISVKNVISVYGFADWMQEESLLQYSLLLICKHAEVILKKCLDQISTHCLIKILQEPSINISEKDLIEVVWFWSHNECLKRGLSTSNENKRQLLFESDIMNYIRFLTLTSEDIEYLEQLGLLTSKEIHIIQQIAEANGQIKDDKIDGFILNENKLARNTLRHDWTLCHRPVIRSMSPLVITNVSQSIKMRFKCHKTVFIGSFIISSRQCLNSFYNESLVNSYLENIIISLSNSENSDDCIHTTFNKVVDYNSTILIEFPKPMLINEEEWYNITMCWPGRKSQVLRYPLCCRPPSTNNSDIIFMFDDDYENISSRGSLVEGVMYCL